MLCMIELNILPESVGTAVRLANTNEPQPRQCIGADEQGITNEAKRRRNFKTPSLIIGFPFVAVCNRSFLEIDLIRAKLRAESLRQSVQHTIRCVPLASESKRIHCASPENLPEHVTCFVVNQVADRRAPKFQRDVLRSKKVGIRHDAPGSAQAVSRRQHRWRGLSVCAARHDTQTELSQPLPPTAHKAPDGERF